MKLHRVRTGQDEKTPYGWAFFCPGCQGVHVVPVEFGPVRWTFNGDENAPTFSPSLLNHATATAPRCHLFVKDGKIEYLPDCGHAYAGKTIDVPEFRW